MLWLVELQIMSRNPLYFKTVSLLAVTLSRPCEQALNLFPFACGSRVTSREPPNGEPARARSLDYITRLALNYCSTFYSLSGFTSD